jgi:hypothetical protein
MREKNGNLGFAIINIFCSVEIEKKASDKMTVFVRFISDIELVFKICKELQNLNNKKI